MSSSSKKLSTFEFLFSWQNRTFLLTENQRTLLRSQCSLPVSFNIILFFLSSSSIFLDFSQQLLNFGLNFLSSFKNMQKFRSSLHKWSVTLITWHVRSALCTLWMYLNLIPVIGILHKLCKNKGKDLSIVTWLEPAILRSEVWCLIH